MKILFLFSNPSDSTRLRVDKEDAIISKLARSFSDTVIAERLHASDIENTHDLISKGGFDIIHFSGHGSAEGIYLDRQSMIDGKSELVSANQLVHLVNLSSKNPLLIVVLACYSHRLRNVLAEAAPFVITADSAVPDFLCLSFTQGFYEHFFKNGSVVNSFEYAQNYLASRNMDNSPFYLSRRTLMKNERGVFIECKPSSFEDSILVNMDDVVDTLDRFGLGYEELCHLIARKLRVHQFIFRNPRESAILPIGRLMFGEFSWDNARDVVRCRRLMKLSSTVDSNHWALWVRFLLAYNDLASGDYRFSPHPGEASGNLSLSRAIKQLRYYLGSCINGNENKLLALGFDGVIPNIEFIRASLLQAEHYFECERYPETISALEMALTNFHEIVDQLTPPEELME